MRGMFGIRRSPSWGYDAWWCPMIPEIVIDSRGAENSGDRSWWSAESMWHAFDVWQGNKEPSP
jgi:hypothetical protein